MLVPSKYKYRKTQRGVVKGKSKGGNEVVFGDFGLQAVGTGFITSRQIESARVAINRVLNREGKMWIKIFPHKPYTKRAAETRIGQGKGDVDHYFAIVQPGRVIFEVGGVDAALAKKALVKASHKLPLETVAIAKR